MLSFEHFLFDFQKKYAAMKKKKDLSHKMARFTFLDLLQLIYSWFTMASKGWDIRSFLLAFLKLIADAIEDGLDFNR